MIKRSMRTKLKTQFFGYDKASVDKEIKDMGRESKENIEKLKMKMEKIKKENEELSKQIEELKNEKLSEQHSLDFMNFALKKSQEVTSLIEKSSEKEILEIRKITDSTKELFDSKIAKFNNCINETQLTLDGLLNDVLKKNLNIDDDLKQFLDEKNIKEDHLNNQCIMEEKENKILNQAVDNEEVNHQEANNKSKDLNECGKADIVQENNKIEISHNIECQHKPDIDPEEEIHEKEQKNNEEIKESKSEYKNVFEKVLNSDLDINNLNDNGLSNNTNSFWGEPLSNHDNYDEAKNTVSEDIEGNQEEKIPSIISKEITTDSGDENRNLITSSVSIGNKYVVGKIAGADVLDNEGKIIIAKDSLITEEIVQRVEKEGKLAELIVNMTIPNIQS